MCRSVLQILSKKCHFPHPFLDLASKICFHLQTRPQVVQTLDSAIHRINHYPVDMYLGNQWRYTLNNFYPVDSATQRWNNRGLAFKKLCHHYLDYEQQQKTINTFVLSRTSLKNHTRFKTKMSKVYTRFQTKTKQKPNPLGWHIPVWLIWGVAPGHVTQKRSLFPFITKIIK